MTAVATIATRPIAIKIDQDTRNRVKRLAEARHRTSHWLMREAISQYVEREEKRETFRQAGIQAWNEYQANGLHVTQEEADAWLAKLEDGQESGMRKFFYLARPPAFSAICR